MQGLLWSENTKLSGKGYVAPEVITLKDKHDKKNSLYV